MSGQEESLLARLKAWQGYTALSPDAVQRLLADVKEAADRLQHLEDRASTTAIVVPHDAAITTEVAAGLAALWGTQGPHGQLQVHEPGLRSSVLPSARPGTGRGGAGMTAENETAARVAELEEANARLAAVAQEMADALEVAWDLSTWADSINWRARDKDNNGEWLDDLRDLIRTTQMGVTACREAYRALTDEAKING